MCMLLVVHVLQSASTTTSVVALLNSDALHTADALDARSIIIDEAQDELESELEEAREVELEAELEEAQEDDLGAELEGEEPQPERPEEKEAPMIERLKQLGVLDDGSNLQFPRDAPLDGDFDITYQELEIEHPPDHLLLPEYVERSASDHFDAKHVRAVWIGDLERMPARILEYHDKGYNLTLYNSAEAVLDGFSPHVRRGFQLAIPSIVSIDFLKFLLLYKYGGLVVDADTFPSVPPDGIEYPAGCDAIFGKEVHLRDDQFERPIYRKEGHNTYLYNRPFQLLNWAMVGVKPRNRHVRELINASLRHFFGMRDMVQAIIQDVAGSGLLSDYVALLHAERGLDFVAAFKDRVVHPVDGVCMNEDELHGRWIAHSFLTSWNAGLYG